MWRNKFMTVCRVLGLAPVRFEGALLLPSALLRCYSILITVTVIGVTVALLEPHPSENLVLKITFFTSGFLGFVTGWSALLNPSIHAQRLCKIYNDIQKISIELQGFGCKINNRVTGKTIFFLVLYIVVNMVIPLILEMYFPLWSIGIGVEIFLLYQISHLFTAIFFAQYVNFVFILRDRLLAINNQLRNIKLWVSDVRKKGAMPSMLTKAPSIMLMGRNCVPYSELTYNDETIMVSLLQKHHLQLAVLAKNFISFYSPTILIVIMYCFCEMSTNTYRTLKGIFSSEEDTIVNFVSLMKWNVVHSFKMLTILIGSSTIENEMNETGLHVHSLHHVASNEILKKQLEVFSIQLIHQKTKFTLYGLLTLDMSFFLGMVGACVTYVVIIVDY